MNRLFARALLVVAATTTACTRSTGIPPREHVTGVWVLSSDVIEQLRRKGFVRTDPNDHRIELRDDGSCDFKSYWIYIEGYTPREKEASYRAGAGKCTWEVGSAEVRTLSRRNVIGGVTIEFESRPEEDNVRPDAISRYTIVDLLVKRERDAVVLAAMIGDPDEERSIDYVRQP